MKFTFNFMNRQALVRIAIAAAVAIPIVLAVTALVKYTKKEAKAKVPSLKIKVTLLYATCTGTSRNMAVTLGQTLRRYDCDVEIIDLKDFDEFALEKGGIFLFLVSTYTNGQVPESAQRFMAWLRDFMFDFRVDRNYFAKVTFGVFGLGGKIYKTNFCTPARELNDWLIDLGATSLVPTLFGDDASNLEAKFESWQDLVVRALTKKVVLEGGGEDADTADVVIDERVHRVKKFTKENRKLTKLKEAASATRADAANAGAGASAGAGAGVTTDSGCCGGQPAADSSSSCCQSQPAQGPTLGLDDDDEDEEEEEDRINSNFVTMDDESDDDASYEKVSPSGGCGDGEEGDLDLEDIGKTISVRPLVDSTVIETKSDREMVTKLQRKALVKEGYRIIGTHSAVKLCRWTKNQMRGRGGCYKHSFYGITSYQCMEATPSLACANKCVFCWRHHKNPVGTEWRWKTDSPSMIVSEAVSLHQGMINEMRGIPGVLPERLVEGNTVKHCALSLVGEPIMYPLINEMLKELHDRKISSFMVTNAQFPDRIEQLHPVTQLYVSVDAATKDSLKAIDRPLFKNFWDRFIGSLIALKEKKQRTVYRLTLVKDWNMEDTEAYAELIELGQPDFIEIKAMTYCGKSDASSLTMQNVPWHREVCAYSELIAERLKLRGKGAIYSIATEHEHSCCILLAREDKFKVDGVWHTWINYERYHELVQRFYATGENFTSQDYMERTPEWALYQSDARGFDPVESRWKRNKAGALVEVDYKSSSSGCG